MREADLADLISRCVLEKYERLPTKCKVRRADDQRKEWTILAGIVLMKGNRQNERINHHTRVSPRPRSDVQPDDVALDCVSLASGMKCLPRNKMADCHGHILHDWHAEILCIRGFHRWLLDECTLLLQDGQSMWIRTRPDRAIGDSSSAFELQSDVSIHMFISAAPCGDASMELIMANQSDATPWSRPAPSADPDDMLGRGHFDQLGVVRRKPSRVDAPGTWSKSCSDKLAEKQCTSLLTSLTAAVVDPSRAYLSTLVLPQEELIEEATTRAFGPEGRLSSICADDVQTRWRERGYEYCPFGVLATSYTFRDGKVNGAVPSNVAVLVTGKKTEVLINGVLQGRKQSDPSGASSASRKKLAQTILDLKRRTGQILADDLQEGISYRTLKHSCRGKVALVKQDLRSLALRPWRANDGDDEWAVEA